MKAISRNLQNTVNQLSEKLQFERDKKKWEEKQKNLRVARALILLALNHQKKLRNGEEVFGEIISAEKRKEFQKTLKHVKRLCDNPNPTEKRVKDVTEEVSSMGKDIESAWLTKWQTEKKSVKSHIFLLKLLDPQQARQVELMMDSSNEMPTEQEDFINKQKIIEEARSRLNTVSVTESVSAFLVKLNRNTATYEDLTPEVREWIENNNISKRIRISLR